MALASSPEASKGTPNLAKTSRSRFSFSGGLSSKATTEAPRARRTSAVAKPLRPTPITMTESVASNMFERVFVIDAPLPRSASHREPHAKTDRQRRYPRDGDKHGRNPLLRPAGEFEVMMQWAHLEDAFPRELERHNQRDYRERFDDENDAEQRQHEQPSALDGGAGDERAEQERSSVSHKYFSRIAIE